MKQVRISRSVVLVLLIVMTTIAASHALAAPVAQSGLQWYMVDPHFHSVVSAEATIDLGISSQAKDLGYNALFITDHNNGSSFHINNLTANHMIFEDAYTRWDVGTFGNLSATSNLLANTPVNSGAASLRLRSASSSYGETYIWTKRGPTLRSGNAMLQVSIYPVQIDANSGAYVSVSLGGDPSVQKTPAGYTTINNLVSPGKSIVFVWQLGNPRAPDSNPNARVYTFPLSYTLNTWNHYVINVSDALANVPANELPLDYNGYSYLKMSVGAGNGTAEAYFDTYAIDAASPVAPADEFVYRTSVVDDFDTADFKQFASYEAGQQTHTQRFNFAITNTADFVAHQFGHESIPVTHQSGYPAQLNHPDTTIQPQQVIDTQAHGADLLETRELAWETTWDTILNQGVPLLGSWSSDAHEGVSAGKSATFLRAPSLQFDDLIKALYEGRSYNARNDFAGNVVFNLNSASVEPYPARYPVYVSDAESTINVSLNINGGLSKKYKVHWIRNGATMVIDSSPGATYQATKAIDLSGSWTFVRSEARSSTSSLKAASQPIFFKDIAGLPVGRTLHIEEIVTPNNRDYNRIKSQGITSATWNAASQNLQVSLQDPVGSLVRLKMKTDPAPQQVRVNGTAIAQAATFVDFVSATNNSWFYDGSAQSLYLKVLHAAGIAQLSLEFGASDSEAPTVPTNLVATAVTMAHVNLGWLPSTDNFAVDGYTIYRDGALLTTVQETQLTYADTTVASGTTYTYAVDAFDAANNHSALSAQAVVTTPSSSTYTFTTVADSYVSDSTPTSNFGLSTALRVDASPIQRSYLRFDVQGLSGLVTSAKLRIFAETASSVGYSANDVTDDSWGETTINFNNAPALGSAIGSTGALAANTWQEFDVTALIAGNGPASFGLATPSTTGIRFASGETTSSNAPVLIIQSSSGGGLAAASDTSRAGSGQTSIYLPLVANENE